MSEAAMIADLNATLVQKALADQAFRAALIADPNGAVAKALGTPLPAGVKLKVLEATATEFTIVLPYELKAGAQGELSDDALEAVAGGSKSGASHFFSSVGNYVTHHPAQIGSAAAMVATMEPGLSVACGMIAGGSHHHR